MKYRFFVDAGNTAVKIAEFDQIAGWQVKRFSYDEITQSEAPKLKSPICGVSVVPHRNTQIETWLQQSISWVKREEIPASWISYNTPETLGLDRVIAARGAWDFAREQPVVLIDSGSAITIDFVDRDGVFQGGIIAPGLSAFEAGISSKAPLLPKVDRMLPNQFPGKSTVSCLQWGITGGFMAMIEGFLHRYQSVYSIEKIVLTGGDAPFIHAHLPEIFQAEIKNDLIFDGLRSFVER